MTDETAPAEDEIEDRAEDTELLRAELANLKEQVLRYAAEAENTKRRAERETNDARAFAIQKFARDLLGVADNLARAREHAPANADDPMVKNLAVGLEMTEKDLLTAFERNGLKRVDPLQAVAFEGGEQVLLGHLQPNGEVLHHRVIGVGRGVFTGARQIVGDAQKIAGELLDSEGPRVIGLALGAAFGVLGLGGVAQHLFLE